MLTKKLETIPCILCRNIYPDIIYQGIGHKKKYISVSICQNDGLVYLNPRLCNKSYDEYYKNEYAESYFDLKSNGNKYNRIKEIIINISTVKNFSFPRILEVGAGKGDSLEYLSRIVPETKLYAIEKSRFCLEFLQEMSVEIIGTDIEDIQTEYNFDLIIMNHVLEHSLYPVNLLKQLNDLLSENGMLYVAMPNQMKPFGSIKQYWFRQPHTYYFSKETLMATMGMAGFTPSVIDDGYELWGIFKKGTLKEKTINVYKIQKQIINKKIFIQNLRGIIVWIPRLLVSLIPDMIKEFIPLKIKSIIGKVLFKR